MSVRQRLLVTLSSVAISVFLSGAAMAQTAKSYGELSGYYMTGYLNRNSGGTLFDDRVPRPPGGAVALVPGSAAASCAPFNICAGLTGRPIAW